MGVVNILVDKYELDGDNNFAVATFALLAVDVERQILGDSAHKLLSLNILIGLVLSLRLIQLGMVQVVRLEPPFAIARRREWETMQ